MENKILKAQGLLNQSTFDGWLLYDFRRSNELACRFLEFPANKLLTRRFFYFIPKEGEPIKIVSLVEPHVLDHLPGRRLTYLAWQELESQLKELLKGKRKVAMEYSPKAAVPYISRVDGGTIELVKNCGAEVVSSADILQQFTSVWNQEQLKTHHYAAEVVCQTVDAAWNLIQKHLIEKRPLSEYAVQQFILNEFVKQDCVAEDLPICAVNAHSADPHYTPLKENSAFIQENDFILIDLWCKRNVENAVYADITRVGFAGKKPSPKQQEVFEVVKRARDTATQFVQASLARGKTIHGFEVDQVCRQVVNEAGYGPYFTHRTGHSIDTQDHGSGANIDSLETLDVRALLPKTCFSIEPGVYLPGEFGVRLEYNLYLQADGQVQVTGGIQEDIKCLL